MSSDYDFAQQMPSLWGMAHCPSASHSGGIIAGANQSSDGRYDSSLGIAAVHVAICISNALILLFCYSGVSKVTVRGSLDTLLQILPCFRDLEHGATSNTRFVLYFFCSAFGAMLTILSMLLDQEQIDRGYRITLQCGQRLFQGASAVLLTIALNHQREHRHTDLLHGDIGIVQLVSQIRRINYAVVIFFTVYLLIELGASFATSTHDLRVAMAIVSFLVIFVLNAPIMAAATWVAFHKGHIAPKLNARIALMAGVMMRFLGSIDASFWNKIVLEKWVDSDPCAIGGVMSFYNMLEIINLLAQLCVLAFVVIEFRRSRSIATQESSLIATAQYDEYEDGSSNHSDGDLQRSASGFDG